MNLDDYLPWNRIPRSAAAAVHRPVDRNHPLPDFSKAAQWIAYGMGRSYGDVCVSAGGGLVHTRGLDRFISFDAVHGILRCEAGVTLDEIIALTLPQGWFLPVTPGTQFVTVGGAIANDVHGKNHRRMGSFGHHVRAFELYRSDGSQRECNREQNPDWFRATLGGMGLTGLISWAEIQLRSVQGPWMDVETIRFRSLDEYLDLAAASEHSHEYLVAWVDCLASGRQLGRGLLYRANHANHANRKEACNKRRTLDFPVTPPLSLVNQASLRLFNEFTFHTGRTGHGRQSYEKFFYPLDSIGHWNRMYGPKGFYQHQSVTPKPQARETIAAMLKRIAASGQGSFLAVLKEFGACESAGLMSFPRQGTTLALDFPNKGVSTLKLLDELDQLCTASNGAIYPAKDARMGCDQFRLAYPVDAFAPYRDEQFKSGLWQRLGELQT